MDTNWKHQKDAITTDQKFRNEDEHLHELDKRHLKESEKKDLELIAKRRRPRLRARRTRTRSGSSMRPKVSGSAEG